MKMFTAIIMLGVITGIFVYIFYSLIRFFSLLIMRKFINLSDLQGNFSLKEKLLILLVLTLAGIVSALIQHFFLKNKRHYGTERIIDTFHTESDLTCKEFIGEFSISTLILSCGGSAGYEGPSGGIGGALGYFISILLKMTNEERKTLLASGIGAGIGAIFLSPVGGGILGAEILQKKLLNWKILPYSLIASFTSYFVFSHLSHLHQALLPFGSQVGLNLVLILSALFEGVVFGLLEGLFIQIIKYIQRIKRNSEKMRALKIASPVIAMFIVGLIIVCFPKVMGGSIEWINYVKDNPSRLSASELIFLPFIKMIASALTVVVGKGGGLFVPSIFIGEVSGLAIGNALHYILPNVFIFDYILITGIAGAFGFIGGVGNIPIAAAFICMEATGNLSIFPYALIVALVSFFVQEDSIYSTQR
ncbi:chloride channel protein [Caldisericum sp.]|uniref:chloride channel protein n=1 Tax=Caldisericum sp. TaxID=2499687 RepID=UPI003D0E2D06